MHPEDLIRSSLQRKQHDADTHMLLVNKKTGEVLKKYGPGDGDIQQAMDDYQSNRDSCDLVYTDGRKVSEG